MTFADLAAGDSVFLDSNTFVFHFAPDPVYRAACGQQVQQIQNQQLLAC
jgi:hypothetical protein